MAGLAANTEERQPRELLIFLGAAVAYLLSSRVVPAPEYALVPAVFWPTSGVAVGLCLRFGLPALLGVAVAGLGMALVVPAPLDAGLLGGRALLEAAIVTAAARFDWARVGTETRRDALRFGILTLSASVLGALATYGALSFDRAPPSPLGWLVRVSLADALSIALIAPLVMAERRRSLASADQWTAAVSLALALLAVLVILLGEAGEATRLATATALVPVFVAVAVRNDPRVTALALALTAAAWAASVRTERGAFGAAASGAFVVLQAQQLVAAFSAVVIAAAMVDRRRRDAEKVLLAAAAGEGEARRKELESQLRQAQKMEAVGTLTGGIAHDFNNVLAAVLGNVEYSLEQGDVPDDVREALLDVQTAAGRARMLVRRLSAMTRREEPRLELVDASALLREVAGLLRATIPTSIRLAVDVPKGPVPLPVDGAQLHQVLLNLGTNAAHAMRSRGDLTLEVRAVALSKAEARARHPLLMPVDYIRFRVKDTGHGMSAEVRERIFEPFFTTKPLGEGTGLGLAVVHGVMEDHKGVIVVESAPGEGTTFELYFPATSAKFIPPPPPAGTPTAPLELRILLVDDDLLVLAAAQRALARAGCRVTAVSSPEEALALVRARPRDYDALVTDVSMPGMTGIELSRAALAERAQLLIVAITGYHDSENEEALRQAGVREIVLKPFTQASLVDALRRHVT